MRMLVWRSRLCHLPTQRLAGRENACSRGSTRVVHASEGQAEIRVLGCGHEGWHVETRVLSGLGCRRRRTDICEHELVEMQAIDFDGIGVAPRLPLEHARLAVRREQRRLPLVDHAPRHRQVGVVERRVGLGELVAGARRPLVGPHAADLAEELLHLGARAHTRRFSGSDHEERDFDAARRQQRLRRLRRLAASRTALAGAQLLGEGVQQRW
mmetsp:Transcript_3280/g.7270  ORF Transcript_3280/g.7270 Transcript_3280/m.7270 type:complete len:212 (+) Transcript_3280:138-773(+)